MFEMSIAAIVVLGLLFIILVLCGAGWYLFSRERGPVSTRDLRAIKRDLEKKAHSQKMESLYRQVAESGGYEVSDK